MNCVFRICSLWRLKLKNDHTLASLFAKSTGTNHSNKQRIVLFLVYSYVVLCATALFYNDDQQTVFEYVSRLGCMILIYSVPGAKYLNMVRVWGT